MSYLFYLFSSLLLSAAFIFILITSTFQARVLFSNQSNRRFMFTHVLMVLSAHAHTQARTRKHARMSHASKFARIARRVMSPQSIYTAKLFTIELMIQNRILLLLATPLYPHADGVRHPPLHIFAHPC